ncbi:MAG: tyrosine-type recombinase/integrase [Rhodospirillaceae bacterium]|nr:tyrosine-type recombinase/integrase [Rhodospirillaceae bacterium]
MEPRRQGLHEEDWRHDHTGHTAAMELLHNGVGCTVIALWLGHESVETTQVYLHADLQVKEKAMERTRPVDTPPGRYRPSDALLDYLEGL